MKFHRSNGGLSRYVKIRYFFEEIRKESISNDDVLKYATMFSEVMRAKLIDTSLLIMDSVNYIKQNYNKKKFHIVSGSDQNELRFICEKLELDKYFLSIHGSPTAKNELVSTLLNEYKYVSSDTVLIGDSINDYEAANNNGIDFIGYNNVELINLGRAYLKDFSDKIIQ